MQKLDTREIYILLCEDLSCVLEDGGVTGMINYLSTIANPSPHYSLLLSTAAKYALREAGKLSPKDFYCIDFVVASALSRESLLELARGI